MYQEKLHVSFDELMFKKFSFFTPGRKNNINKTVLWLLFTEV